MESDDLLLEQLSHNYELYHIYEYTLYKGISARNFTRKFTLADDIVVNDAKLENGMLTISLERIIPEEKKPRQITVK